jgi:hypothetical protein
MSLIVPTSCFLDLGYDPEQIVTIANGLVVIDFGAVNSDRGALIALTRHRPPQPGRISVTILQKR